MNQKTTSPRIYKFFLIILLVSLLLSNLGENNVTSVHAQSLGTNLSSPEIDDVSTEIPLYPGVTWTPIENEKMIISTGFGSTSVELIGSSYLSEPIVGKPSHDLRDYYSVDSLAKSEWYLVDEALGVSSEKTIYYQEPNRYLVVQFGKCTEDNSIKYSCFKIWISLPTISAPVPVLLNVSSNIPPIETSASSFQNPLPVPAYSQNDSSWKNDRLGFPDSGYPTACDFCTIGGYGCFVTSYTMVYNYYQSNYITPKVLNNNLITGGTKFVSNGEHCNNLMPGGSPYAPSGVSRGSTYINDCVQPNCIDSGNIPIIQNEINAGRPMMAYVHYSPGGYKQHMVVITGYSGSTYYINDPWDGGQRTLSSGALGAYVVDEVRQWIGTPPGSGGSLNPPTLLSPGQSQTLTSRSVHFTWQSPNAINQNGYTFRLSTNSNPDLQPWIFDQGLGNEYSSYDFNFSSDGTFYWHMRTWNTSNQASGWITRSFAINTSGGGGNHPPAGFTWCADETGRCSFSGTADVVYGALNSFTSPRSFINGVDCNNDVFGDPISGTRKSCYYKLTTPPTGNLHVEYFNDKNLGGRCYDGYENSTYVFKNWGNGSPASGCNSDNFSARFTGTYNFSGGSYSFHCQHDDGCRIYIDGQLRGDWWWDSSFTGHDWGGTLSGSHEVKIEFYDSGGDARLEAFWSGGGFLPNGTSCTSGEWCAQYYGNKDLSGTPAVNRNEGNTNIDYVWNDGGIGYGFPNDNFSTRWQRNVYFAAGRYRFHIRTDDGGRLWVNNNLVIDQWKDQGATEYTVDLDLDAGVIPLKFEYYDGGGGAVAQLWWDALQLYVDDATFITQSQYPTVNPGENFQIYFEVKNTGTTNWQPASYWLENLQNPLGADTEQPLAQSIAPNENYRWTINLTAPSTPGTYRSQWMISHNGSIFGPNMFIDVAVAGKPDLVPYPLEGRQDPIIISPVEETSVNGTIYAGQPVYIDWGYNNVGNAEVLADYFVDLYIDDQRIIHYPYTSLCVGCIGGFDDWQTTWSTTGWHTVRLIVDPDDTVDESDETNNMWEKQFYWEVVPADLTITTVSFDPSIPYSNDNMWVVVDLQNMSSTDIEGFYIDIYIDDQPTGCNDWGSYYIWFNGLQANSPGRAWILIPAVSLSPGDYQVRAFVDSGCHVAETNEDNNIADPVTLTVSSPTLPPAHDDFDDAIPIIPIPYEDIVDVSGASIASDDPPVNDCNLKPGLASVWYQYESLSNTRMLLDTFGSDYDTYIAVWTGSRGNLTAVGCNDDATGGYQSQLELDLTASTTYYIEIAEYNGALSSAVSSALTQEADTRRERGSGAADSGIGIDEKLTTESIDQAGGALHFHVSYVTYSISGNTGVGEVTLSYMDETPKTVVSNADGSYSINVPHGWSGTITPSKSGYSFAPLSRTYIDVITDTPGENFAALSPGPGVFYKQAPANTATILGTSVTLYWSASSGATSYEYCLDTTNDNACTSSWINNTNQRSVTRSGLNNNTTYYWQVRAKNNIGTTYADGASTAYSSFTVNVPPQAFNKISPANGATVSGTSVTLYWTASPYMTNYEYCLDTTNDNACTSSWVNNTNQRSVTLTGLNNNTTYYWQVRAKNSNGTTYADGPVTAFWSFTVNVPPGAFTKISPANGATSVGTSVTLYWTASPYMTSYEYCLDTTNDNACTSSWVNNTNQRSVTLSGLNRGTTYYWQVRAKNSNGTAYADGPVTAFWSFTVNVPPDPFNKLSPVNSATSSGSTVTLYWTASTGMTNYEYCIDTTAGNTCTTSWVNNTNRRSVTLSGLSTNTTYYWQVRAKNSSGTTYADGSAAVFWSFTVSAPPGEFNKLSPVNDAVNVPSTLTLYWSSSTGRTAYEYCIDIVNDGICTGSWINNGIQRSVILGDLSAGTTYYWQVRAVNSSGTTYANGSETSVWTFATIP